MLTQLCVLWKICGLPVNLMPHGVKTVVRHSCATVWVILKYSEETEAAQSGRMYFYFLFFIFGRILPASSCLSALMISHRVLIPPPPPFTFLRGIGIPMEMVSSTTLLTAETLSLSCDKKNNKNMPNTTSAYYVIFFLCNSHSVETTIPPSSLQLTGTRLGSFVTLVNIMYITEKCEYVFVQNQQKSSAQSLW